MSHQPKQLFALQINFAHKIEKIEKISFSESLLKYTSIYLRLFGFSKNPTSHLENLAWQKLIQSLPTNVEDQVEIIYSQYITFEKNKPNTQNKLYGCFSYNYDDEKNIFDIHFSNEDPEGPLSKNRLMERKKEIIKLIQAIQKECKKNASIHIESWMLSIEAFTRIFPSAFIETAVPQNKGLSKENSFWGQFLDKNGNVKQDLADTLINNTNEKRKIIDEYFPVRVLEATINQEVFFEFYL